MATITKQKSQTTKNNELAKRINKQMKHILTWAQRLNDGGDWEEKEYELNLIYHLAHDALCDVKDIINR